MRCPRAARPRRLALCLALASAAGCGAEPDPPDLMDAAVPDATADADAGARPDAPVDVVIPPPPVAVAAVPWNAGGADLGAVAAVAEQGDALVLFGQRGVQVLAGGVVSATDARVTSWRAAAVIPAGDGATGAWVVGLDATGRLWRLRDAERVEDVTGRYALAMRDARSVAPLAMGRVAFGLAGGLAVADGTQVRVWSDPSFAEAVGAGSRVAARTAAGVRVFDLAATRFVDYALANVTGVAFDARAKLVVTAGPSLYVENDRSELELRASGTSPLRGVVQSGARTWLVASGSLALWDGADVRPATNAPVAMNARLLPSPGGDVWVLGADGRLARFGVTESPDLQLWASTVRPVFARRCTPCHLPGGTGNLDLTTYAAWVARRADIRTQVIVERNMPPPPGMLTADERAAVTRWLDAPPPDGGARDGGPADAVVDAPRDVPRDATPDASVPMDARADAAPDAPADVRTDAPTDVRTDAPADAGAVTYAAVDSIFQRACVRCHGASGALNLADPAAAYAALVNAPAGGASCRGGGRVRVTPGAPMASLLYLKLANMQDCGSSMPRGGTLPAADVETVRRWIAGGAPR